MSPSGEGPPDEVIDWDTASPGPRVWDAADLAYRRVPLSAPGNRDLLASDLPERRRRLRLLTDTYGARPEDDEGNSDSVGLDLSALLDTPSGASDLAGFTERRAEEGAEHVRGHVDGYRADARWLTEHRAALAGANDDQVG